jgi:hypothetical protein
VRSGADFLEAGHASERSREAAGRGRPHQRRVMPISYHDLSLAQIAADLEETLCDLYWNAGERHLEPFVRQLEALDIPEGGRPSARLIEVMEGLLQYDADLHNPCAQELMKAAANEISRLSHELHEDDHPY